MSENRERKIMNINELKVGDRVKYFFWGDENTGKIIRTYFDGFQIANDKGGLDSIVFFNAVICKLEPIYKEIPIDSKNREDVKGKREFGVVFDEWLPKVYPETKYYCKVCQKYLWATSGLGTVNWVTCSECENQKKVPLSNSEALFLLEEARRLIIERGESIDVPLQFAQHRWLNTVKRFI